MVASLDASVRGHLRIEPTKWVLMCRFSTFVDKQEQFRRFVLARVKRGGTVKREEVTGWFTTSEIKQEVVTLIFLKFLVYLVN